jgi:hypothetical protein
MPHPLFEQLIFTRSEFIRGIKGLGEEDAQKRLLPMNCISWNVGHLAWQEQRYFINFAQGKTILPEIQQNFAYGASASTPQLMEMIKAWKLITRAADSWLAKVDSAILESQVVRDGKKLDALYGNLLQRTIYHYWYHTGENSAIRQMLGHQDLPVFVGNIDSKAPFRRG